MTAEAHRSDAGESPKSAAEYRRARSAHTLRQRRVQLAVHHSSTELSLSATGNTRVAS